MLIKIIFWGAIAYIAIAFLWRLFVSIAVASEAYHESGVGGAIGAALVALFLSFWSIAKYAFWIFIITGLIGIFYSGNKYEESPNKSGYKTDIENLKMSFMAHYEYASITNNGTSQNPTTAEDKRKYIYLLESALNHAKLVNTQPFDQEINPNFGYFFKTKYIKSIELRLEYLKTGKFTSAIVAQKLSKEYMNWMIENNLTVESDVKPDNYSDLN